MVGGVNTHLSLPHDLSPIQGVRWFADEALEAAIRYYRESRELCVDLLADTSEDCNGLTSDRGGGDGWSGTADESLLAAAGSHLLRAEYNVGMALFEQKKYAGAIPHLSAVGEGFRKLVNPTTTTNAARKGVGTSGASEDQRARKIGDGGTHLLSAASWKAALDQEGMSDLGGLYALSLDLLGECLASCPLPSDKNGQTRTETQSRAGSTDTGVAPTAACIVPLGASSGTPRDRLIASVGALEASVEAFIAIDDAAGALEPLKRLVGILRLMDGGGRGGRYISRVEALHDRVRAALRNKQQIVTIRGGNGEGQAGVTTATYDSDDTLAQMAETRERIKDLRERCSGGAVASGSGGGGEVGERGRGVNYDEAVQRTSTEQGQPCSPVSSPSQQQEWRHGNRDVVAQFCPSGDGFATARKAHHRVGPPPTALSARRRRRQVKAMAAPLVRAGRGPDRRNGLSSDVSSSSGRTSMRRPNVPRPHVGAVRGSARDSLSAISRASGVSKAGLSPAGAPSLGGKRLGSFAGLRSAAAAASAAAMVDTKSSTVTPTATSENGRSIEGVKGREGTERTAIEAYKKMVRESLGAEDRKMTDQLPLGNNSQYILTRMYNSSFSSVYFVAILATRCRVQPVLRDKESSVT